MSWVVRSVDTGGHTRHSVHWFVFGKGIAVRTQTVAGTETTTTGLVSGTFNGAPI